MRNRINRLSTAILVGAAAILLFAAASAARAQTQNPIQYAIDAGIKNGAVGGGYWRATTGNYSIASYDFVYNLTTETNSLGAGLIIGGDYMWSGGSVGEWNDIKGGFSLNYELRPLKPAGITNFVVKIYGGDAVATPKHAGVGVGNISFVGADYTLKLYKSINLQIAPAIQNRTGQGKFDRTYVGIQGFLSVGF
jgi:hypothetical protein